MTEISYLSPGVVGFRDRRTRMLVIGIFLLLGGIACLLMSLMIPVVLYIPRPPGTPSPRVADLLGGILVYIGLGAIAIYLAVGAIRVRRWVRPMALCLSVIWLIIGISALVIFLMTVPQLLKVMQTSGPGLSRGMAMSFAVGTGIFMVLFCIVAPALLILAFRSADVQATLEFFDPQLRWTDGVPLIVLGLAIMCVLASMGLLASAGRGLFLLFGVVLFGWPGRAVLIVLALGLLIIARLVFLRRPIGWWMLMIVLILLPLSSIITLLRTNLVEVYKQFEMPETQLQILISQSVAWQHAFMIQASIILAVALYIVWRARRHFQTGIMPSSGPPSQTPGLP